MSRPNLRIVLSIVFFLSFNCIYSGNRNIPEYSDSISSLSGNWFSQLRKCNFHINDPRVRYPKFVNFCRKVYNWGDRTFNSYDPAYVIGTGHNWKLFINYYNWHQTYAFIFHNQPVILQSKLNSDLGLTLNFMALSVGYTWNVNQWMTGKQDSRRTFNFSFTCGLFAAEITAFDITGDTKLTKFGNYRDFYGSKPNIPIDNLKHKALNLNVYYFFNHRKYSQGAAYNYSKYQLKSAGSWILGINYRKYRISMDFQHLPSSMIENIPEFINKYDFNYSDYSILGGYGYNHVLPHNWLYNVTILPSIGYKQTRMTNSETGKDSDFNKSLSLNYLGKMSLTYNHKALFISAILRLDGGWYFDNNYTFFNNMESMSAIIGLRF